MSHSFHTELSRIWQISVDLYRRGNNSAEDFPIANELPILSGWGLNKMDVFDYVEDWCLHEEPDLITFVLVHYERWNFFVHEQKSELSSNRLDPSSLPPKTEDAAGIIWLPRILPKARAKLRENYLHQSCMDVVEIDIFSVPITFILPSSYEWSGNGEIMIRQLSSGCLTVIILPSINAYPAFYYP